MKKILIVGGGISGLTAAAYLARSGHKVTLLEKNKEFGGLVSSFKHNGFTFEAGVRGLVNAGIIKPMLNDLGINLKMVKNKVSIGIADKILHLNSKRDIENYGALLKNIFPENKNEISLFIKEMKKITNYVDIMYQVDNPIFKDLKNDKKFLLKKLLPWLPKFLWTLQKINKLNEPVEKYVARNIKNPSACDMITQHFFKATPAFFALGYFAIYTEYFYPLGGVGKLAEAVKQKAIAFNANLKANTMINRVDVMNKIAFDSEGNVYEFDYLIWSADLPTFYKIIDIQNLSLKIKKQISVIKEKFKRAKPAESVYSLYLEVDIPPEYFEKISNGHFFYTPYNNGLGNIHTRELETLLDNFRNKSKTEVSEWLDKFLRYNTFEISIPALRDKSLSPKDKTGLIISFLAEYELFDKFKKRGWYDEFVEEIENRIIDILSATIYPGLKEKTEHKFSFTPISIKNRVLSSQGAIVGWSFEKNIPAINKMIQVNKSVQTPLPNVFQAGQWTYSPAGVPMAVLTGKLAADKICKSKQT